MGSQPSQSSDTRRNGVVAGHIDLGEVECLVAGGDIAFTTLDTPDPAPGLALAILVRLAAEPDYGRSSDGRPRRAAAGDCP